MRVTQDFHVQLVAYARGFVKHDHFSMFIGVLTLELHLHDAYSLKDKRMVANSMLDKIRHRFNVSAAQIDDHDLWNRATLAVAVVSNDRVEANRVLNHVRDLSETELRCDVADCRIEII